MLIIKKNLKTAHPSKLCLVIPLGNGAKVQYPVESRAQAIALYQDYIQQNSSLSHACEEPLYSSRHESRRESRRESRSLVKSRLALQTP